MTPTDHERNLADDALDLLARVGPGGVVLLGHAESQALLARVRELEAALAAERERCARVADECAGHFRAAAEGEDAVGAATAHAMAGGAEAVGRAIRKGETS